MNETQKGKVGVAKETLDRPRQTSKAVETTKTGAAKAAQKVNALDIFKNKDIEVHTRHGDILKCKLDATTQYEMVVTIEKMPAIIFKHGVDFITLSPF